MAMVTLKLEGFKELEAKLKALGPDVARRGLRSATFAGTRVVRDAVTRSFRTGRSAPGEPPGIDKGFLKSAIVAPRRRTPENVAKYAIRVRGGRIAKLTKIAKRRKGRRKGKYSSVAGPNVYGKFLEFGTSKMAARPFLTPAFFNNVDKAIDAIKQGLAKAIAREIRRRA